MKTTFKPDRGHNYHVIHETATGGARSRCRAVCGDDFSAGAKSTHSPTCPRCCERDNPFGLTWEVVHALSQYVLLPTAKQVNTPSGPMRMPVARVFAQGRIRDRLLERDLITPHDELTRRGHVLGEDWTAEPVPMARRGVVHRRKPLSAYPICGGVDFFGQFKPELMMDDAQDMTMSRYEKLRRLHEEHPLMVTCVTCLART
jgi:hypothetical protein